MGEILLKWAIRAGFRMRGGQEALAREESPATQSRFARILARLIGILIA